MGNTPHVPEVRLRLGLGLVAWPGQQLVVKMGLGLSAELLPGLQLRLRTAAQLGLGPGLEQAAQLTQVLVHDLHRRDERSGGVGQSLGAAMYDRAGGLTAWCRKRGFARGTSWNQRSWRTWGCRLHGTTQDRQKVKAGRAEGRNPWCQKRGLSGHNIHRGGASRANGQGWDTWMMIRPVRKISIGGLAAFLAPGERADELNAVNGSRRHD